VREQFKLRVIDVKEPWHTPTRLLAIRGMEAWKLMEVHGECHESWRYEFKDGKVKKFTAKVVYEEVLGWK
jgi:hypothetical protein